MNTANWPRLSSSAPDFGKLAGLIGGVWVSPEWAMTRLCVSTRVTLFNCGEEARISILLRSQPLSNLCAPEIDCLVENTKFSILKAYEF